ncbi:MAG: MYXO-CTERM sorting domain-containing protein, partial [Polyangia bacterium]
RHRIALRIEALTGQTPPPMDGSGGASGGGTGDTTGGNGATPDPGTPASTPASSGGHSGCSHAPGRAPIVTPFSIALLAVAATLFVRRRARTAARAHIRR